MTIGPTRRRPRLGAPALPVPVPPVAVFAVVLLAVALLAAGCAETPAVDEIGAGEAADLLAEDTGDLVVIDVRTPAEFAEGHVDGARNLDLEGGTFEAALADLDPDADYVLYCATGNRSGQAATMMADAGFTSVRDAGGYDDLADAGVPTST